MRSIRSARMMPRRKRNNRGVALIASYLVLAMVLVYTNAMTLHSLSQQQSITQLRDQFQALGLTQAAVEQFREDFFQFVRQDAYQVQFQSDAVRTMTWLDNVGQGQITNDGLTFDLSARPGATGQGIPANHRQMTLPSGLTLTGQPAVGEAWIAGVEQVDSNNPNPLERNLIVEGTATVGRITKRIRLTFRVGLRASDVFRYAYFVNNYGWFDVGSEINGDVRANGNLRFNNPTAFAVQGDLYASKNPDLLDPVSHLPSLGNIFGDPAQRTSWADYWDNKPIRARPALILNNPSQPTLAIGGTPKVLSVGMGWDSQYDPDGAGPKPRGDQHRYDGQAIQDMPYLGNLSVYKQLGQLYNNGVGSTITYYPFNTTNGTFSGTPQTLHVSYDNGNSFTPPLILIGDGAHPIAIDGPFVAKGDVIIRGTVTGKGTLYVGRNMHIVGSMDYKTTVSYPEMQRDTVSGQLRELNVTTGPRSNLGTVCSHTGLAGQYYAPGAQLPANCM